MRKKHKKNDQQLNVFKPFYFSWRHLSQWKTNFKIFFRQFKFAFQRATRGFSDKDTWDIDYYLLTLIPMLLNRFLELNIGYPDRCETFENWQEIIKNIITKMNQVKENLDTGTSLIENKEPLKQEEIEKLTKEAFDLLASNLYDLWW